MNALLVRVGIDSTCGGWNAPVRPSTGEFVYVSIPESEPFRRGLVRDYAEFSGPLAKFGQMLPEWLRGKTTHLDPDFENLTYGDQGQRGRSISKLRSGDVLAFFASMRPLENSDETLIYALIGIYVIKEIVAARSVTQCRWHENAHTRRQEPGDGDIVVRARPGVSGRLKRCIPIGEYRARAYRVRRDLLSKWGDLRVNDGFIQKSAWLPPFRDAPRFLDWLENQDHELVAKNNPTS